MGFNPFIWWSNYRLERLRLKYEAQNKPYEMISKAVQSQSDFIKEYFGSFKVTELPTTTVMRDSDEFALEAAREQLNPGIASSIRSAIAAGAIPDLKDLLES